MRSGGHGYAWHGEAGLGGLGESWFGGERLGMAVRVRCVQVWFG